MSIFKLKVLNCLKDGGKFFILRKRGKEKRREERREERREKREEKRREEKKIGRAHV